MHVRANGILRGNRIELDHTVTDLPDGSPVSLVLAPREVPIEEKHRIIDELRGAWASDPSLASIFERIAEVRDHALERPINLDDPA